MSMPQAKRFITQRSQSMHRGHREEQNLSVLCDYLCALCVKNYGFAARIA